MERLAETTPLAPEKILHNFNNEFKELKNEIAMPPETNGLHKIKVYRSNGPVPTPIAFNLDRMEQGFLEKDRSLELSELKAQVLEITSVQEEKFKSFRDSSEAAARKMVEEAQEKAALEILQSKEQARIAIESAQASASQASAQAQQLFEQVQTEFLRKQDMLEQQLKIMEKTLLPITQSEINDEESTLQHDAESSKEETLTENITEKLQSHSEEIPEEEDKQET
jgi:hypothetical protein